MVSASVVLSVLGFASELSALKTKAPYFKNPERPNTVCHRGTSGRWPEHSIGGETDCYFQNAEMIELDVHPTKDGQMIVNHDPHMDPTTNINEYEWLYKDRETTHAFPRYYHPPHTGYYFIDFSLAEIKTLKRKMRYDFRSHQNDGLFEVLSVRESIENLLMLNQNFPREREYPTGLYIETKQFNFYKDNYGLDVAEMLYDILKDYGLHTIESSKDKLPIIIQCFEKEALQRMKELTDLPTVFLISGNADGPFDFKEVATYADAVCPAWSHFLDANKKVSYPSKIAEEIRAEGMDVHAYVAQDDNLHVADNPIDEYRTWMNWGLDFLFTEFPHMSVTVFDYYKHKGEDFTLLNGN